MGYDNSETMPDWVLRFAGIAFNGYKLYVHLQNMWSGLFLFYMTTASIHNLYHLNDVCWKCHDCKILNGFVMIIRNYVGQSSGLFTRMARKELSNQLY